MAFAKLANAAPAANTLTTLYTTTATFNGNLLVCNPNGVATIVDVAVSALATPTAAEYIAKGLLIPANGTVTIGDLFMSAAELVVVKSGTAGVSYRLQGNLV